jgi:uncharacterized membrane protein YqiK
MAMLSGVFSFLGGAAFRWILGELFGWLKARDEHKAEMERTRLQIELERERATLQRAAAQQAADLGIKVIEAQSEAAAEAAAALAHLRAIEGVNEASKRDDWIGAWNAMIRPELAQVAIIMFVADAIWPDLVTLTPVMIEVFCAALGMFVGERIRHRGA